MRYQLRITNNGKSPTRRTIHLEDSVAATRQIKKNGAIHRTLLNYEEDEIRQSWIFEVNDRMKAFNEGRAKLLDFEGLYSQSMYSQSSI